MSQFYCMSCEQAFENTNPDKMETIDPVFGSCWKYTAPCPDCGTGSFEKPEQKHRKRPGNVGSKQVQSCCGAGGCCCR